MTNTPNFNFTIAEGTDTVNLLTQLYPNFTSLDTILQAIKESGTTTAVTTKVGTVHNIVRNVADCNVIRWIATANYAAGDTFTVDGNAVTATAMDGTALPAGAFVINQSVLAILNSGVLTIVGVPGVSSVAASAVTYDNTVSELSATDVQDAIDEIVADIPTGFAASAITYDNSVSNLSATNAQDAIDELVATELAHTVIAEVTSDGTKTIAQLGNLLYAQLTLPFADGEQISLVKKAATRTDYFHLSRYSANDCQFSMVDVFSNDFLFISLHIAANSGQYAVIKASPITLTDNSSNLVPADEVWQIVRN